ncbi:hypothetical protein pb186bvf_009737 [Paramecium bursaria]
MINNPLIKFLQIQQYKLGHLLFIHNLTIIHQIMPHFQFFFIKFAFEFINTNSFQQEQNSQIRKKMNQFRIQFRY